jgi:hypothetical protein
MDGCMQNSTKEEVQVTGRFVRCVRVFVCGGLGPQRNRVSSALVRNAVGVRVQEAETKSGNKGKVVSVMTGRNETGRNETGRTRSRANTCAKRNATHLPQPPSTQNMNQDSNTKKKSRSSKDANTQLCVARAEARGALKAVGGDLKAALGLRGEAVHHVRGCLLLELIHDQQAPRVLDRVARSAHW